MSECLVNKTARSLISPFDVNAHVSDEIDVQKYESSSSDDEYINRVQR